MKRILETERLYLRELTIEDAHSFFQLNNDEEVLRYTGDQAFANVEAARNFLEAYDQYEKYGMGRWAVINKWDEAFLGWCGIKYRAEADEFDIGYRFFRKYWNCGYASESASACLKYGFEDLGIEEMVGRAMKANKASIRVLEKIGMQYDRDADFDGIPGVIFKLSKPDWKAE